MAENKRLLFLSSLDITGDRAYYDGVTKKNLLEIRTFKKLGYVVEYIVRVENDVFLVDKEGCRVELTHYAGAFYKRMRRVYSALYDIYEVPDVIYVRYEGNSINMWRFLAKMKRKNPLIKIFAELPTYIGKWEPGTGFRGKLAFVVHRLKDIAYRMPIDYILTFDNHKKIFGYKTIQIENFADIEALPVKNNKENINGTFNILAMAMMTPSHGFDRIIKGIYEYYKNGGKRKICLHLVGKGKVENNWLVLADELGVRDSVVSHGLIYGKDLDNLFDVCHVGAGAIAIFRKKCQKASELKIREYTARCLPFFYSAEEPQIVQEKFCLKIPNNENPVDIQRVISFYNTVNESWVNKKMRDFALKNFSSVPQLKKALEISEYNYESVYTDEQRGMFDR